MEKVLFAVNGTLMRGLELHQHLLDVGAKYIETTKTIKAYRLFSIDDKYPGMIYEESGQTAPIQVEVYEIDKDKLIQVAEQEPEGLYIGRVFLDGGTPVLGVLIQKEFVRGKKEITKFGGWKKYLNSLTK